jgi:hypothetical protein
LIKNKNFLPFLITNHQINGKHSQMDVNSTAQLAKYAKKCIKICKKCGIERWGLGGLGEIIYLCTPKTNDEGTINRYETSRRRQQYPALTERDRRPSARDLCSHLSIGYGWRVVAGGIHRMGHLGQCE